MANPLQPKVLSILKQEYTPFVINLMSASTSGNMDILACINGIMYGFEIKWKNDTPSELQKTRINLLREAGGKGFFIRSVEQLRNILENNLPSEYYPEKSEFIL